MARYARVTLYSAVKAFFFQPITSYDLLHADVYKILLKYLFHPSDMLIAFIINFVIDIGVTASWNSHV